MKYRYTKFTGDLLDDLDLEDLVAKLSDLLLSSGFGNPYATDEDDKTMQALHNFRRLRTRFDRDSEIHEAFLTLACGLICLNAYKEIGVLLGVLR